MHFIYVKIPVGSHPDMRQLEDQVDQVLKDAGAGSVAGWGDSLGAPLPDGSRPVAYIRIDIDVVDVAAARSLLQAKLPSLGAPAGTEIHYTMHGRQCKDIYKGIHSAPAWLSDAAL